MLFYVFLSQSFFHQMLLLLFPKSFVKPTYLQLTTTFSKIVVSILQVLNEFIFLFELFFSSCLLQKMVSIFPSSSSQSYNLFILLKILFNIYVHLFYLNVKHIKFLRKHYCTKCSISK